MLALGLASLVSCSQASSTAPRLLMARRASLAVAPSFDRQPAGGPSVALSRIRGVLVDAHGDSVVAEAPFRNHSAALAFTVVFTGESAIFRLELTEYDQGGSPAYRSIDTMEVRAGNNPPLVPRQFEYVGLDSGVTAIRVAPDPVQLQAGDSATVGVTGATRAGRSVTVPIRVGWTSRADAVAAVDSVGTVRAGAGDGTTWIVARSASGAVDSTLVRVHAAAGAAGGG